MEEYVDMIRRRNTDATSNDIDSVIVQKAHTEVSDPNDKFIGPNEGKVVDPNNEYIGRNRGNNNSSKKTQHEHK